MSYTIDGARGTITVTPGALAALDRAVGTARVELSARDGDVSVEAAE